MKLVVLLSFLLLSFTVFGLGAPSIDIQKDLSSKKKEDLLEGKFPKGIGHPCPELYDIELMEMMNLKTVKKLFEKRNCQINEENTYGETPLFVLLGRSVWRTNEELDFNYIRNKEIEKIFDFYISKGANVYHKMDPDISLLHYAAMGNAGVAIIKKLVETYKFDVNQHDSFNSYGLDKDSGYIPIDYISGDTFYYTRTHDTDQLTANKMALQGIYPQDALRKAEDFLRRKIDSVKSACETYDYFLHKGSREPISGQVKYRKLYLHYLGNDLGTIFFELPDGTPRVAVYLCPLVEKLDLK